MERADRVRRAVTELVRGGLPPEALLERVVHLLYGEHPRWGWVGFYLLRDGELVLGPHVGPPTEHTRIPVGVGVCGAAVSTGENQIVHDVRELENYLACSIGTRSEIVVLVRDAVGRIVGQLDVDSDDVGAFGPEDEALLEGIAPLVAEACATAVV